MADALRRAGHAFVTDSPTNQIFVVLPHALIEKLEKNWGFYVWQKVDADHSVVRLVTSWATPEEVVRAFIEEL